MTQRRAREREAGATPLQTLPEFATAERFALAALLLDKDTIRVYADLGLEPKHFGSYRARRVYARALELFQANQDVTLFSLLDALEQHAELATDGDQSSGKVPEAWLHELTQIREVSPAEAPRYAQKLIEVHRRWQIIQLARELETMAFNPDGPLPVLLDQVQERVLAVLAGHERREYVPVQQVIPEVIRQLALEHAHPDQRRGIPTHLVDLDARLGGMLPGQMIIIAGRPGMGKTALGLSILREVARHTGPVGIFSLEMKAEEIAKRLLAMESGVDSAKFRHVERLTPDDFQQLDAGWGRIDEHYQPVFINDNAGITLPQLLAQAKAWRAKGVRVIMVDYLQLLTVEGAENRNQEIARISRTLKRMAMDLEIPVLVLSQLSRDLEKRGNRTPQLSDLRDSGSIEADADVVIFIHSDQSDEGDGSILSWLQKDEIKTAQLIIAKARQGGVGVVNVQFVPALTLFRSLADRREDENAASAGLFDLGDDDF